MDAGSIATVVVAVIISLILGLMVGVLFFSKKDKKKPANQTQAADGAGDHGHPKKEKSTFEKVFDGIFNLFTVLIGGSMAVVAVMFAVWVFGKATAPAVSPYRDRVAETQPRKPSGMSPYSYTFDSGCVEVDLPGRWSSYPLGGKIKFIHISTGRTVLEIVPGVETNSGLMPGWYRICPADSKATGVEIWK